MKKIFGIALIILLTGFVLKVSAQSRPGAVKSSEKTETAPNQEEAEDNVSAEPKPVSRPVSKPVPSTETAPISKPVPVGKPAPSTGTTAPAPTPKPKAETVNTAPAQETVQPEKGPSREKRMHAEERSKGHAFSGKGKGGDKNIVDPDTKEKDKKDLKSKKNKKAKKNKK